MAANNNGFHFIHEDLCEYPYEYYTRQLQLYPNMQSQQQLQQQLLQEEIQRAEEERVKWEELKREMADRNPLSFLETDNSFLMPWNCNPNADNHASSTSRLMNTFQPGSFFSHNEDSWEYPYDNYTRQQPLYPCIQTHQLQQQQLCISYLRLQQQQQREQLEMQRVEEERVKREELLIDNAGRQLLSFLETDNSFLTPWNWNPDAPPVDNQASSSSRLMNISYPGSFFSHNIDFSSRDQVTEYLSATFAKLDSSDNKDGEQVSNASLNQNLPRTNVGTEREQSEDLSGTNPNLVSDNSTNQVPTRSSVQDHIGTSAEQFSDEFNEDQITDQYTLKFNRSKKFAFKAKWKNSKSKVRQA